MKYSYALDSCMRECIWPAIEAYIKRFNRMFNLASSATSCYTQSPPLLIQALHDCFSINAITADNNLASIALAHCANRNYNSNGCFQIWINRTDVCIIGCATTQGTQGQVYSKANSNHQGIKPLTCLLFYSAGNPLRRHSK